MTDVVHHDRTDLAPPVTIRIYEGRVARIHRDGDPLRYSWGDEYRDDEGLDQIVEQLVGKPVTLLHPEGFVSQGSPAKVVGKIIAARRDGDYAVAKFEITDEEGYRAIQDGTRELSLGYAARRDEKGYQRDIRIDHLAIVPKARCGATCALRADEHSECTCENAVLESRQEPVQEPQVECPCKNHAMPYSGGMAADSADKTVDELQKKLGEALAEVAAQKARADQADALAASEKKRAEAAELEAHNAKKDLEAEKTRFDAEIKKANDAAEKARQDAAGVLDSQVAERVALLTEANKVLGATDAEGKTVDRSKMSPRDIKVAIVKHVDGDDLDTSKSDDFVNGAYEGALRRHAKSVTSRADTREAIQQVRQDNAPVTQKSWLDLEREAMAEMNNRSSQAWMPKN